PMKTRSEVGTTSSLEFFHRKGRKSGRFGDWGWGPKRAGARGSTQRFTSRRSRSTPSGDRRRRSPFRSSDLPVTHLRARLVDTARCLSREPVFTDSRWSEVPDGLPATDPSRTRLAERSGFFRFLELQAGGVDAVAEPGGLRAVLEDVAQVRVAAVAGHLRAAHPVAVVGVQVDR